MTHILGQRDADLHDEYGEHYTTAPTTDGRTLESYERRIRNHLAAHAEERGDHARAADLRQVR